MDKRNSQEKKYINALNLIPGVGTQTLKKLVTFPSGPEAVWKASFLEIKSCGLGDKLTERIIAERKNIIPEQEWSRLEKENIFLLTPESPYYPCLLKEIADYPYILYAKGRLETLNSPSISLVGARRYTSYGEQAALSFSRDLADAGLTIVSGMAFGIDTFCHQGAISKNGLTIAVLGNGLDDANIHPRSNFNLSREILEKGILISEYPPGTPAGPLTFPARNRIIAGISSATLVIEASSKSGALITARMALEYGREVLAIPGSIFSSQSLGTNDLIKKGAKTVTNITDVLEELAFNICNKNETKKPPQPETEEEKVLLGILSANPIHIDNIAKISKLKTSEVGSALAIMEIKGWIKNIGGQNYIIT